MAHLEVYEDRISELIATLQVHELAFISWVAKCSILVLVYVCNLIGGSSIQEELGVVVRA